MTLVVVAFAVAGMRLVWLQAITSPAFAERAESQYVRDWEIPARRGSIFDREGKPLAVTVEGRTVYAVPSAVEDPEGAAKAIASTMGGDEAAYLAKLTSDANFVYIARKADIQKATVLKEMGFKGLHFADDYTRRYPGGDLAAQTLGFVGVDDEGLAGLEQHYEELLAGSPGRVVAERDPKGRIIPGGLMLEEKPVDGSSILLTIDREVQHLAQQELAKAVESAGARSGSIVVLDPEDGAILAIASVPTFDPNRYSEFEPYTFRNRAITDLYEPGSTMKSFTAAAVVEEGIYEPESRFTLEPTIKVGRRTIGESHPRPTVDWSLTDIVAYSSNVGAVKLGLALGPDKLYEQFSNMGFGEKAGVDFPGEAAGVLPPTENWSQSTIYNLPFGQGISVTSLQLARSMAAIANGGELVTPHVLAGVPDAPEAGLSWPKRRAMSEQTATQMRDLLTSVVEYGTGERASVPGYRVAGKTGTAQMARTDGRGYEKGSYVASFAGFLPAEDPAVVIVVNIDKPTRGIYGGALAAPVFSSVGQFCMTKLVVAPPKPKEGTAQKVAGTD